MAICWSKACSYQRVIAATNARSNTSWRVKHLSAPLAGKLWSQVGLRLTDLVLIVGSAADPMSRQINQLDVRLSRSFAFLGSHSHNLQLISWKKVLNFWLTWKLFFEVPSSCSDAWIHTNLLMFSSLEHLFKWNFDVRRKWNPPASEVSEGPFLGSTGSGSSLLFRSQHLRVLVWLIFRSTSFDSGANHRKHPVYTGIRRGQRLLTLRFSRLSAAKHDMAQKTDQQRPLIECAHRQRFEYHQNRSNRTAHREGAYPSLGPLLLPRQQHGGIRHHRNWSQSIWWVLLLAFVTWSAQVQKHEQPLFLQPVKSCYEMPAAQPMF